MPKKVPFKKSTALSAPTSLVASDITTTSITLTWVDDVNVTHEGYEVSRNGVVIQGPGDGLFPPDARSFTDSDLTPETQYTYTVRAISSLGNSSTISVVASTDEPLPVISVQPLSQSANDGATATFFVTGQNITTYQWELSTDGGSNWSEIGSATNSAYTTGALSATDDGNQYRCKVYNDSLDEVVSNAATLTVISATLLAPTNLTATVASTSQVDLAWTDNATTETEYRIYRNNSLLDTIAANSTSYSDTTVSSGNSYTYKVSVWDGSEEAFSIEVSATVGGPEILASPTDEYVAPGGTASFGVAADTTGGALTYQWEYSDNAGASWADAVGETSARIDVAGLTDANSGRLYRCKVSNGVATSTSNSATATVYAHTYPLDTYAAAGAYGFAKLSSAYAGDCIKIFLADSIATTVDIGFGVDGKIDEAAMTAAHSTYGGAWKIHTIYDQSGNGNDLVISDLSQALPIINQDGSIVVGDDGEPCFYGVDNFPTAGYECTLGSAIALNNFAMSMLIRRDEGRAVQFEFAGNGGDYSVLTLGLHGFASNRESQFFVRLGASTKMTPVYAIEEGFKYCSVSFGTTSHALLAFDGVDQQAFIEPNYPPAPTGTSTSLFFQAHVGEEIKEFTIYSSSLTATDIQNRALLGNRNWMVSAPTTEFAGSKASTYRSWKLLKYADQFSENDFKYPVVSAKSATSITVGNRDWSWIPAGKTLRLRDGALTLTASATPPVFSNNETEIFVTGSTDSVAVGDEVLVGPFWDGVTSDLNVASGYEVLFRDESGTSMDLPKWPTGFPPYWYLLNTDGNKRDLSAEKTANLYAAQPDTSGLNVGVGRDSSGNHAVMLYKFSLASLTETPTLAYFYFDDFTVDDSSNPDDTPYIGVITYNDTDFDSATVTWNTAPITVSPLPSGIADDNEVIQTNNGYVFDLTTQIAAAYNGGASSVTVMLYQVNSIKSKSESARFIYPSAAKLAALEKGSLLDPAFDGLRSLQEHRSGSQTYGFGRPAGAIYSQVSLPLQSGSNGNPLRYWHGLARRCAVANIVSYVSKRRSLNIRGDTRQLGGYIEAFSLTWKDCQMVIDPVTYRLKFEELLRVAESLRSNVYPTDSGTWNNANMSCKGVEGLGQLYYALPSDMSAEKTRVAQIARFLLLGKEDGDFATYDMDLEYSLLSMEGNIREGVASPIDRALESDYFGRSWAHIFMCRHWTYGASEWDWLDDVIEGILKFIHASSFQDYSALNGVAYGGRTSGVPNVRSQYHWYGNIAVAAMNPNWYWLARDWKVGGAAFETTLAGAITAAKSEINNTVFRSYTTQTLKIPANKNHAYAWPDEASVEPRVSGWADSMAAAFTAGSAVTFMPGTTGNWGTSLLVLPDLAGSEDFVVVSKGAGTELYKAMISAPKYSGWYLGINSPQLTLFAGSEFGPFIYSKKSSDRDSKEWASGTAAEDCIPLQVWSDTVRAITDTLTYYTTGEVKSGACNFTEDWTHTTRTRSWNGSDTMTATQQLTPANSYGVLAADDVWVMTKTLRILDKGVDLMEGVEVDVSIDYTAGIGGAKQVAELHQIIPIYESSSARLPDFLVEYYAGTAFTLIVPGVTDDTWISGVTWLRFTRDYGDGAKQIWIKFASAESIKLDPLTLVGNKVGAKLRRVLVDLHPNTGVMTNIPASAGCTWTVTTTEPSISETGISAALVIPETGVELPEGGMFWFKGYVNWGSETEDSVVFQYSTNYAGDEGAATWTTIDSGVTDGVYYVYQGGEVPSGATAVRILATSVELSTASMVVPCTVAAMTTMVHDTMTDANETLLPSHSPDIDVVGLGWTVPSLESALKISSNAATPVVSRPRNGCTGRINVGSADYFISAKLTTSASTTDASGLLGPYIGGRLISADDQYFRAKLLTGFGIAIETKVNEKTTLKTNTSWVPATSTTYLVEAQLIGRLIIMRVKSADGLTTHVADFDFAIDDADAAYPEAAIGVTRAADSTIDDVTIKTW